MVCRAIERAPRGGGWNYRQGRYSRGHHAGDVRRRNAGPAGARYAGWPGFHRACRRGHRRLAFLQNESGRRDRARGASDSRAGVPRQQVYRTFSAHARALSAPRWIVDGSRTKRHAGRAAKRKTGGAGTIVGGTRARAEQSVRRGAPLGGGVADAWKLAPLLADANLTDAQLESFAGAAGASLGPELTRFGTLLEMERIAAELENSTARISDLIKAIKEYSYMDQAPLQEVDIKSSLETTLIILHHKLKRGIVVTREYAADLPKVVAYGSELNQVWTNLIDNAADAMGERGKLLVRAVRENDYVLVEIADDGPGIPPEVQSRIFEPFFTTKGVGEGTGLGLDVVHRIVRKMRGLITVKSVPGDTRFQVRIPIQAAV